MMTELIDRQAVLEKLKECAQYHSSDTYSGDIYDAIDEIEAAPAVDAVEVVRCKDCKHMIIKPFNAHFCRVWHDYNGMGDEGFCNYGERREGNG